MKTSISKSTRAAATAALVLALVQPLIAHSWVDQLNRIALNGTFIDPPGYINGYKGRAAENFPDIPPDQFYTFLTPPNGRPDGKVVRPDDKICSRHQPFGQNSAQFPVLTAAPGDWIALRYQENGHVTLPQNSPNKPQNRGTVYIYGTSDPDDSANLADVFGKWSPDGTGGNGKGRLLATRNYDDLQCHQTNNEKISVDRQAQFKKAAEGVQGENLWCQNDFQLRDDLEVGKQYGLFWVWHWPTMTGPDAPTDQPTGDIKIAQEEFYTSCMAIKVVDPCSQELGSTKSPNCQSAAKGSGTGVKSNVQVNFAKGQDLNYAAIADQMTGKALLVNPGQSGGGGGGGGNDDNKNKPDTAAPTPTTKGGSGSGSGSGGKKNQGHHQHVKTVTVTQGVATVTVTAAPNGAVAGGAQSSPVATSTPTLPASSVEVTPPANPQTTPTSTPSAGFPSQETAKTGRSPPDVRPFLRRTARARRIRRGAGEWRFGF